EEKLNYEKKTDNQFEFSDSNVIKSNFSDNINFNKQLKIHGVCFDNYLIVENIDKILLIDQHAASEAILYSIKKEKFNKSKDVEKLLIPAIVEVDKWLDNTENKIEILNRNGFLIEKYEGNTIIIKEIPSILLIKKDYQIAIDIILKFIEDENQEPINIIDYILIEASCKEAIKKGDKLNLIEIHELANEYFKRNISNCPHGRPAHFEITKNHLEKLFQRKK
ncbi:MAG TPA: hypothetical protein PK771_02390, partial [Spirochaetota bacterium]|nr:hypothetical protein [Spirochaetota bacterium]